MEISRTFGKSPSVGLAERIDVLEVEVSVIAVPLIFDKVYVHINAIGPHDSHAAFQLFPSPVPGRNGKLLLLRSQVIVIEGVMAARRGPARTRQLWRKPDSRKAGSR